MALKNMIERFCSISGQLLYLQKSFIKFSPNIAADRQQQYKNILRMESKASFGVYLGVTVDVQKKKDPNTSLPFRILLLQKLLNGNTKV